MEKKDHVSEIVVRHMAQTADKMDQMELAGVKMFPDHVKNLETALTMLMRLEDVAKEDRESFRRVSLRIVKPDGSFERKTGTPPNIFFLCGYGQITDGDFLAAVDDAVSRGVAVSIQQDAMECGEGAFLADWLRRAGLGIDSPEAQDFARKLHWVICSMAQEAYKDFRGDERLGDERFGFRYSQEYVIDYDARTGKYDMDCLMTDMTMHFARCFDLKNVPAGVNPFAEATSKVDKYMSYVSSGKDPSFRFQELDFVLDGECKTFTLENLIQSESSLKMMHVEDVIQNDSDRVMRVVRKQMMHFAEDAEKYDEKQIKAVINWA